MEQTFFEPSDIARHLVCSQNDLTAFRTEPAEGIQKKLFLSMLASGQELNVVENQRLDPAKNTFPELSYPCAPVELISSFMNISAGMKITCQGLSSSSTDDVQ
jgi:hypothetical protein